MASSSPDDFSVAHDIFSGLCPPYHHRIWGCISFLLRNHRLRGPSCSLTCLISSLYFGCGVGVGVCLVVVIVVVVVVIVVCFFQFFYAYSLR